MWMAIVIALCSFAGLRRVEVCALQVGDVDFLRRELRVERQVQWTDDGRMEIRGPKYGSERTVYISDGLVHYWPSTSGCAAPATTRRDGCSPAT